jgi:hypothetical protein
LRKKHFEKFENYVHRFIKKEKWKDDQKASYQNKYYLKYKLYYIYIKSAISLALVLSKILIIFKKYCIIIVL